VKKAFVIDDQRAMVEMLTLLLADMGVQAEGTTAPRQAHAAIAAVQPHLILLDLMMPDLDGLTLLDELQRDPRTATIPVVLCTAAVLSPSLSRLIADRGIGILAKPFDVEQLRAIVDAVTSSR
jgi:two-component system phosphate regulon response regulator PhoB